jgi:uncharacterized protein (DUF3084 family)
VHIAQVRHLRDEVFNLRRDKAVAESKENEVRHELSDVRQQLDGMSSDQYKNSQRDNGHLKKQVRRPYRVLFILVGNCQPRESRM